MSGDSERDPHRSGLSAFTTRFGLVRPVQGRYVAGVCAAVGRATGTDPVLWRVLLAVLACFGGVGLLIYLVLWLLVPEEGDTAAPVEALFGQGRSGTSPLVATLLMALGVIILIFIAPRALNLVLLGAAVTLGVMLLLQQQQGRGGTRPARPDGMTPPSGPAATPPGPVAGPPAAPAAGAGPAAGTAGPEPTGPRPATAADPGGGAETGRAETGGAETGGGAVAGGAIAAERSAGWGATTATTAPVAPPPGPPRPAPPPQDTPVRSGHPRPPVLPVAFFAALLVLGAARLLELGHVVDVPLAGYVAAALAVVGVALVVGAWTGGARALIVPGLLLSLALPVAHAVDGYQLEHVGTQVTWTPTTVAELQDEYEVSLGEGVLDLREVDFAGQEAATTVRANFGEIRVLLPPDVDLEADAQVRLGAVRVLGVDFGGVRTTQTITDTGGPGGGTLRLDLRADVGHVEVSR